MFNQIIHFYRNDALFAQSKGNFDYILSQSRGNICNFLSQSKGIRESVDKYSQYNMDVIDYFKK